VKSKHLVFVLLICLASLKSNAQFSLNPAVDTIHNNNNREVIHTLFQYLNLRFNGKDGRTYWLPAEANRLKAYDFYEAHNLYQITFDDIIILGITQPEKSLFKVKVLFDYIGTDKQKTIWSISDFYLTRYNDSLKFTNALYVNMRFNHYKTVVSNKIIYHFPYSYKYQQSKVDSANKFISAIETFFNKSIPGKIEYATAPTCESLYEILGDSYQVGTLSSSTTYCGYFDTKNKLIITSGDEFYKHELLRTINILYPGAPDLMKSGITTLWGGSMNKPVIYHLKKLYPYLLQHPEVLDKVDDFNYFDDETNPSFVMQAIVINYILKHDGKAGLIKLIQSAKVDDTITGFLKDNYSITDTRGFFLKEFDFYKNRSGMEFEDIFNIK